MRTLAITLGLLGVTAIGVFAAAQAHHRRENCAPPEGSNPDGPSCQSSASSGGHGGSGKLVGYLGDTLKSSGLLTHRLPGTGACRSAALATQAPRMAAGAANEARNLGAASRFRGARQGNRLHYASTDGVSIGTNPRAMSSRYGKSRTSSNGPRKNCMRYVCDSSRALSQMTICCVGSAYRLSPSTRSRRVGRDATLRSMAASISPTAAKATPNCSNITRTRRRAFTNSPLRNGFGWSK